MAERPPSYLPGKFKRIHLELTNRCNFSCVFCPDGIMTRKRGMIDEDLARSALDQIADLDLAEKVTFHVMGEPMLHPRFFQILDHAHSLGLNIGLTTNGSLLSPRTIQMLADRDLHQIDISLQSPGRESFHATRGSGMDFDKYRSALLDLVAACAARPEPPIFKIRMMTTKFAARMREQLDIPDFIGSTEALRAAVRDWTELIYDRVGLSGEHQTRALANIRKIGISKWNVIEISPKIFIETYLLTDWGNAYEGDDLVEARHGYCFGMRDHFAISYTGDVLLCCVDYDGRTSIGNLNGNSLIQVLRSRELEEIVKGFRTFKLVHPYCRRCLGSRSRLGSWLTPPASVIGLKILKPLLYRHYRLFR